MEIHYISSGKQTKRELIQAIEKSHHYADYIHLREKEWQTSDFLEVITSLIELGVTKKKIIINEKVEVVSKAEVGGVQLGTHSLSTEVVKAHFPDLRVGCSVHRLEEALAQESAGADYLIYGHVFSTASKPGLPPRGVKSLKQIAEHVKIPVIAIGGIQPCHIPLLKQNGAHGIAVLSGVLLADDVEASAISYYQAVKEGK